MWPGANQGVPVQGGEEAAGLLDGPGLQVQQNFQNWFNWPNVECQNKLLLFSMAVAPVELSQETTTENSTLAAVEIAEEEEVDTFLQVIFFSPKSTVAVQPRPLKKDRKMNPRKI